MQYPNPAPIAAGVYYRKEVVDACIKAMFLGVLDLSLRGYSMELDFTGFAKVRIMDRNLHVFFSRNFTGNVQTNVTSWPTRSEEDKSKSISATWKTKDLSNAMMNFHPRPDSRHLMRSKTRTLQLGIMSLDLTSTQVEMPGSLQRSASVPLGDRFARDLLAGWSICAGSALLTTRLAHQRKSVRMESSMWRV